MCTGQSRPGRGESKFQNTEATCLGFSGTSRRLERLKSTELGEGGKAGGEAREDNGVWSERAL